MSLTREGCQIDAVTLGFAPLVVALDARRIGPVDDGGRITMFRLSGGETLFVARRGIASDLVARQALVAANGSTIDGWRIARTRRGQPRGVHNLRPAVAISISISKFGGMTAVAVSPAGAVGIDVETIDRVTRNADICDSWLGRIERRALAEVPLYRRSIELTCHWVLKEAYGKAIGMGLDYDLAALDIMVSHGQIVTHGSIGRYADGYRFDLLRDGRLIFGVARRCLALDGQAVGTGW